MAKQNQKQKQNKLNALWWSYHTGRFISPEEVDEFEFACIGMSRNSRGAEIPIGTRVTIKDCEKLRCKCNYAKNLIELREKLTLQVKDKKEKKELINIARRIIEDADDSGNTGREEEETKGTGERKKRSNKKEQKVSKGKRKSEDADSDRSVEDMLFGGD